LQVSPEYWDMVLACATQTKLHYRLTYITSENWIMFSVSDKTSCLHSCHFFVAQGRKCSYLNLHLNMKTWQTYLAIKTQLLTTHWK